MESQQPLEIDETGSDDQFEEDEGEEWFEVFEPEPEMAVNDANHDTVVMLLAICLGVGALVALIWIGQLDTLGIFGEGCWLSHTRVAMCTTVDYGHSTTSPYVPAPLHLDVSPQ